MEPDYRTLIVEKCGSADWLTPNRPDSLNARWAQDWSRKVVPDDRLAVAAQPYVDGMLRTSPMGLRMTKEGLNWAVDAGSLAAAIAMENRNQYMTSHSPNFAEGVQDFLERREPVYVQDWGDAALGVNWGFAVQSGPGDVCHLIGGIGDWMCSKPRA